MSDGVVSPGLLISDWSNMCHRAFHGLGGSDQLMATDVFDLANKMALDTATAFLFSGGLVVHVLDGGYSGRRELFEGYKATRSSSEDRPYGLVQSLGAPEILQTRSRIPYVKAEGYEADDVMANLAWEYVKRTQSQAYILSNDKDMYQITTPSISILRHRGSGGGVMGMELMNPETVQEQFGFPPRLIPEYKALQGDVADNIPRLPRIGHGVACRLIQQWGGAREAVAAAVQDLEAPKFTDSLKRTLIEYRETVYLNLRLTRLVKVPKTKELLDLILQGESPIP